MSGRYLVPVMVGAVAFAGVMTFVLRSRARSARRLRAGLCNWCTVPLREEPVLAVVGKRAEHVRVYCQVCGDRVKRRLKLERRANWIVVASGILGLVVGFVWSLFLGDLDSTWIGLLITGFVALFGGLAGLASQSPVRYVRRSELGSTAADI